MARTPNEVIKKAERMYRKGKSQAEIARKFGVSYKTVRDWKKKYNWNGEVHRGSPYGNRRAVGNSGNPHPNPPPDRTKHGGYSKIYMDSLSEEEEELLSSIPDDEETMLIEQIQIFYLRERRLLNAIKKYNDMGKEVVVSDVYRTETKRSFSSEEEEEEYSRRVKKLVDKGERLPGEPYNMQTNLVNKNNIVLRLEAELTSVQRSKTRSIEALSKIRAERRKIENEQNSSDAVDDWLLGVLGESGGVSANE